MSMYLEGMLYGMLFLFALGPAFFGLLQTTLHKSWRHGLAFASAIWLTDATFIAVTLLGFSSFMQVASVRIWLGIIGASVLIVYGIVSLVHKTANRPPVVVGATPRDAFIRGLLLNGFNPMIIVFWAGLIGALSASNEYQTEDLPYFFAGFLTMVILLDVLRIAFIRKLAGWLHQKWFGYLTRIIGVLFIVFGVRILVYLIWGL